jgi:hypothetical protein
MRISTAAITALMLGNLLVSRALFGGIILSDDFNSYSDGDLVGQGDWVQLGSSTDSPVQVSSGSVVNMSEGQDVQKPFSSTVARQAGEANGKSLITEFDVNLTSVAANTSAGDFFAHLTVAPGNTTMFNRFYARAGTAPDTFQIAVSASGVPSPAATNLNYGGDLPLGQTYHVQSQWKFIPGASNDEFSLNVNNAPYLTPFAWDSNTSESVNLGVFNLRQGGSNAPGIASIDNIVVTLVPEPATSAMAILSAGGIGVIARRRRR